jgi:hypothetical protein
LPCWPAGFISRRTATSGAETGGGLDGLGNLPVRLTPDPNGADADRI